MHSKEAHFERLRELGWWDYGVVSSARIAVVGAGALGVETCKNLGLYGVGRILIVDFDTIALSNLTRSVLYGPQDVGKKKTAVLAERISALSPGGVAIGMDGDARQIVTPGVARRCDLLIGCVDNLDARIHLTRMAGRAGIPYLDGGLSQWEGCVQVFDRGASACYACALSETTVRDLELRHRCPMYAERAGKSNGIPTTPALASVISGVLAQEALCLLHNLRDGFRQAKSYEIRLNLLSGAWLRTTLVSSSNCAFHPQTTPERLRSAKATESWDQILRSIQPREDGLTVWLPAPVAYVFCGECGVFPANVDARAGCSHCGKPVPIHRTNQIRFGSRESSLTPADCGLAGGAEVRIIGGSREHVIEIASFSTPLTEFFGL